MQVHTLTNILAVGPDDRDQLNHATTEITMVTANTREVRPGACFVAIAGANFDGHEHLDEVFAAGAVLAVVERPVAFEGAGMVVTVPDTHKALAELAAAFNGNPSRDLNVIGVTGTNGKTTVTHLISKILGDNGMNTGIMGTLYNKVGDEKLSTVNTTSDANTIQRVLAAMRDAGNAAAAIEVSSIALDQGRNWGTDFDTAVFTNLTEDHLDYHKTMAAYFAAKSLLFSELGSGLSRNGRSKTAVINTDDPAGVKLVTIAQHTVANVITYGVDHPATVQATDIATTNHGTRFNLHFYGRTYPVHMHLVGEFNVYNVLAAFGAAYGQGIAVPDIIRSIEAATGVPGRFQPVPNDKDVVVLVDYAHTPDGLENVLTTIRKFAKQRIFCVVGAGGDRDHNKRHIMGEIAVRLATDPVFTSDNPRTEDPDSILDMVVSAVPADSYQRFTDRREAIRYAINAAQPGDVVLIAGKGHEDYQIIGHTKHHFDDFEEATAALNAK
ncbi:UDP-N-acetylmuramoyl-L-alanyl-D-glutamate--2,6-diaminopimelate ligase [Lacticaseibacillus thailandensis]|uniref:UDP-N-acetylmuramoyl-L-alanyl-D-glutamate--2,6-diaminopimelate ligase n=1 Tax=Lacticaseibacillus thailandensis DSM 22698 = JCM 13996 TaxID=1423810 RepID=A0A0R2C6Q4_9LACO|nr:UDP-N-acetylmuramoyl-L-alanyl-D-glutamate--2,6-diaminopimelate ligase [Lacticaseibacillus thailandensis]KRM86992.1 UDP-N-acetylmuramoylalanyl-D-glutamate--2,6-diami nopimelate ligase [Lacticaseibacillus thailandensis DSM 22698 = JCM 13996]